jgi:Xaa-Pro aminopeptidase
MPKDPERSFRARSAMNEAGFDALVLALPKNVLLLTGYWPILGTAIAVAHENGHITLVGPNDEAEYFESCGADNIIPFNPASLEKLTTALDVVREPMRKALVGLERATIGLENSPSTEEASYVAIQLYQSGLRELVQELLPNAVLRSADEVLARKRALLTPKEQAQLRTAAMIARDAYEIGAARLTEHTTEAEAAQYFQTPLWSQWRATSDRNSLRMGGRVSIMSGTRSGSAYGSFAMSSNKQLCQNELLLVHCNSYAGGYWTDITRTYFLGTPNKRVQAMYDALLEASRAGIAAVKAGVQAKEIDRAVRDCLAEDGFAKQFKHGTGHGVGFSAIDHRAYPRLHPMSPDILEVGMAMNIEPGIYFEEFGGMRQCDMVLVTQDGCEVLTPFHNTIDELIRKPIAKSL